MIRHDPGLSAFRRPYGAAETGAPLYLACESDAQAVTLRLWSDTESREIPLSREGTLFSAELTAPAESGVLFYCFAAEGEESGVQQITVYRPAPAPEWYKDAICYQIFPDRFARERDYTPRQPSPRRGTHRFLVPDWDTPPFYPRAEDDSVSAWPFWGGTLRGIGEKIPYLRSLGVSCLYLNPIFAASSNHRYDTADYFEIDPLLGTTEDFERLCADCAGAGIRIILDGVFSHTGADSRYFDKFGNYGTAEQYREWYRFGEQYTHGYECWWDVPDLPNVDELNESYREFICGENGVLRYWLRHGASGWRLDVADELPDEFIRAVRAAVKAEKSDAVLLGEVWEDASNKCSYGVRREYFGGEELDGTMHYPFRSAVLDFLTGNCGAGEAAEVLETLHRNYPPENLYAALNLVGSHDRERALTLLHGDREKMKILYVLQCACPGVPCIYYGDEAGAMGGADPYNRAPFPWGREDAELLEHYRAVSRWYLEHPALRSGGWEIFAEGEDVLVSRRRDEHETVTVWVDRKSSVWSWKCE